MTDQGINLIKDDGGQYLPRFSLGWEMVKSLTLLRGLVDLLACLRISQELPENHRDRCASGFTRQGQRGLS